MAKENGTPQGRIRGMANLASLGIHMVAATFIGLFIGIYLDEYFSTAPWLMIVFLLFGLAAGFKNLFTAAKRYGFTDDPGTATMTGSGGGSSNESAGDRDNGGDRDKSDDRGNGGDGDRG